jgi:hypothetical protein
MNDIICHKEDNKGNFPALSQRYLSPTINYPSANRFGMFSKAVVGEVEAQEESKKKFRINNKY